MDGELLFELRGPNGQEWRLYENGRATGFPEGTVIVNRAKPLLDSMRGEKQVPGAGVADKQAEVA